MTKKNRETTETAEAPAPAAPAVLVGDRVLYTTADDHTAEERETKKMGAFVPEVHSAEVVEVTAEGPTLLIHAPSHDYRRRSVAQADAKPGTPEAAGKWSPRPTESSEL